MLTNIRIENILILNNNSDDDDNTKNNDSDGKCWNRVL